METPRETPDCGEGAAVKSGGGLVLFTAAGDDSGNEASGDHSDGPGEVGATCGGPEDGDVVGETPEDEGPSPTLGCAAPLGDHGLDEVEPVG